MRILTIALLLTILATANLTFTVQLGRSGPSTWTVDDDGPADFSSIQEAINSPQVADGDTIFVREGTYYESIILNKTVSLVGEDVNTTILNGGGAYAVVYMLANNSRVEGFTIAAGVMGINIGDGYMRIACGNLIVGNLMTDVGYGVFMREESSNNTISTNAIEANGIGIELRSSNNTLLGNIITGNDAYGGICCEPVEWGVRNNDISSNRIRSCRYGILLDNGARWGGIDNNILEGNDIADTDYGICVYGCPYNDIIGNTIAANREVGIALIIVNLGRQYGYSPSQYNTLSSNNITNNHYGILITGCWNNEVVSNFLSGNIYGMGLHWEQGSPNYDDTIYYSHDNTIVENTVTASTICGIELKNASGNSIYNNNFVGNGGQVCTKYSINEWDDGYPSGGNYWSDYADSDLFIGPIQDVAGSDAIWDHLYTIDADNEDRYPLVKPWTPSPTERIHELTGVIETWNLLEGIENSLISELEGTLHLLVIGNEIATRHRLHGFMSHVEALRGKKLNSEQADYLLSKTRKIIDVIDE
jgi:parallel beta-helix repeat protein